MRFRPLFITLATLLCASPASAIVVGDYPDFQRQFSVFGNREVTGNTSMVHYGTVNTALASEGRSRGDVTRIPQGATIESAYLFWSGTATENGPDPNVHFTLPDGTLIRDLDVRNLQPGEPADALNNSGCIERTKRWQRAAFQGGRTLTADLTSFYCRRDVTYILQTLAPNYTGAYSVDELDALPGWPLGVDGTPGLVLGQGGCWIDLFNQNRIPPAQQIACQAMYAGWSLVIVWSHPDVRVRRNITLYDGFVLLDDDDSGSGLINFEIDGFTVAEDAEGEFAFFGLEGDEQLGSTQEDQPPPLFCDVCPDFVEMTIGNRAPTQLFNGGNPVGNLWNGSTPGGATPGVDLDIYDIGASGLQILRENDQSARMRAGTGDGRAGGATGGGELVFLGWSALSLDTYAPDLNNPQTRKSVFPTEAGPGQTLLYRIEVVNDGSADATNIVVRDIVPTGTTYRPGTTRTDCGADASDVAGTTRLESGLTIANLPFQPPGLARCVISFEVTVDDDARPGDRIRNIANIASTDQAAFNTNTAETQILGPELGTPLKSVRNPAGGTYQPGQIVEYTIEVVNDGQTNASGITVTDRLPAGLTYSFANPAPSNVDGATGTVTWTDVAVEGRDVTSLLIFAQINELPGGTLVTNQAEITADFLGAPRLTDDPDTPAPLDGTTFVVVNGEDFTTSTKTVSVDGDGAIVPGALLNWEISLINTGNRNGVVSLTDPIPAVSPGSCVLRGIAPGLAAECSADGRLTITGTVPPDQTRTVSFSTVLADVVDGTELRNIAYLARDDQEDLSI
ncbi:MAG: hypothetical protein VX405_11280, partial [Myxococcota bacterium]|nr:hypothetical protein [Myxococcota bacterium]